MSAAYLVHDRSRLATLTRLWLLYHRHLGISKTSSPSSNLCIAYLCSFQRTGKDRL